jgi:hypothetical protein
MRFPTIATPRRLALAVALAGAFAAPAAMADLNDNFNFSSYAVGTNLFTTTFVDGISFNNGLFDSTTNLWQTWTQAAAVDPTLGSDPGVFVGTTVTAFGANTLPVQTGLDGTLGQTFVSFGGDYQVTSFSLTMDGTSYGNPLPAHVFFVDSSGAVVNTLSFTQTANGSVSLASPLTGTAAGFVIEAGKVYTGLSFTAAAAVPEPSEYALMATGLLLVGAVARRKSVA